ncbi:MAG: DEAD/DEAH box helicase [Candidatus Nanoarchaeia archaeon]|nr:DEAD/DEAH box helicase [Candidatus Nanoarchaeia archaeon]
MQPVLRSVQVEAINNTLQLYHNHLPNGGIVIMATGIGKTLYSIECIKKIKSKNILYLVNNREIQEQIHYVYQQHGLPMIKLNKNILLHNFNNIICIGMVQTLHSNSSRLRTNMFDLIIIDEAHHSYAKSYKEILSILQPNFLIGMTATPERTDLKPILPIFYNNIIINVPIEKGIKNNWLAQYTYMAFKDTIDYSTIKYQNGQYSIKDLNKKIMIHERDEAILREYKKYFDKPDDTVLGFCCSMQHAQYMSDFFNQHGICSDFLTCLDTREKKNLCKQLLNENKLKILFTVNLYNEGIDIPNVSGALFLRPTNSYLIWKQQFGRLLRIKNTTRKKALVLDFVNNQKNICKIYQQLFQEEHIQKPILAGKRIIYKLSTGNTVIFHKEVYDVLSLISKRDEMFSYISDMSLNDIKQLGHQLYNELQVIS